MGILNFLNKGQNWSLIGTTSTDPQQVPESMVDKLPQPILEKMIFGFTTYVWQNEETGAIKREEFIGLDETPLSSLLAKVDRWGKYEILLDGKKYVIVKMQENNILPLIESQSASPIQTIAPTDISKLPVR